MSAVLTLAVRTTASEAAASRRFPLGSAEPNPIIVPKSLDRSIGEIAEVFRIGTAASSCRPRQQAAAEPESPGTETSIDAANRSEGAV